VGETPFDFLSDEQNGRLRSVRSLETLGAPDAVIIRGTKNTTLDLDYIRRIANAAAKLVGP
jgi:adenosylcobyric acid synthase